MFYNPFFCAVFISIKVAHYKTTQLKKQNKTKQAALEQTEQIIFVKLKTHQKEPNLMSEIRAEGNLEVRKPQTQQARLQLIYRYARFCGQ